jgi:metal-responsive CopG/Arc/MetJ family transcriptional regulator
MTLDEDLVAAVDRAARKRRMTRSAFAREALRAALAKQRERELEDKHRRGYARSPVRPGEFDVWEKEHAWGDE